MDQEREDYADPGTEPLPLPSVGAVLIALAVLAVIAAVWFWFAVLIPAQAC